MTNVPDFANLPLGPRQPSSSVTAWSAAVRAETAREPAAFVVDTPEGIPVKPLYTEADRDDLDFIDGYPGIAPYVRGPYPTMYVNQPWTIRQYAGFSTAEDSNAFYRRNLAVSKKLSEW